MRVIPIADPASAASACGEESGEVRPEKRPLARRDFPKGSGLLFGMLTIVTLAIRQADCIAEQMTQRAI